MKPGLDASASRTGGCEGLVAPPCTPWIGTGGPPAHPIAAFAKPAERASPPIALRQPSAALPQVLAIGSSTGGPQALFTVVAALRRDFALPVLITQHMPKAFTAILAGHLKSAAGHAAAEARDGERIEPGRIYIAPGDFHMEPMRREDGPVIRLSKAAPENFYRPSVDPMFRAVATCYGDAALGCILTGMGRDGSLGAKAVVAAGGTIIAQDRSTSLVWGMPGAVAAAGICSAVLPLGELAPRIRRLAGLGGA